MVRSVLATALLLFATDSAAQESILVDSVNHGSPAAAAGLQAGDYIIRLDGREIATHDDLKEVMATHQPGDSVPLTVRRGDETVDLTLTFGVRPGGGVSIGVRLAVTMHQGAHGDGEGGEGSVQCLAWIDETYRIGSMMQDLGLELSDAHDTMRACVGQDTRGMISANVSRYCDNVFKIHCSGLELLTEIGEAQVRQCEEQLNESLGLRLEQHKGWKTCGQHDVFDRYSNTGESSDENQCRTALLDECGTNIDAVLETGKISPEQRGFVECCSTDALDPESRSESDDRCRMIDDSFSRGPCHDRSICINRFTSEWIHCSALE